MRKHWTREELIDMLKLCYEELGKIPSKRDLDLVEIQRLGVPNYSTFLGRFGSWRKALTAAFPEPDVNRHVRRLADDEAMRADLKRVARILGRAPTVRDMIEFSEDEQVFHPNTYIRHYGSWKRAVQACLPEPPF